MNKYKEKEQNLFQSLSKLDSITDLVVNSKKKNHRFRASKT
jgi:hypothetical protein